MKPFPRSIPILLSILLLLSCSGKKSGGEGTFLNNSGQEKIDNPVGTQNATDSAKDGSSTNNGNEQDQNSADAEDDQAAFRIITNQ